MPRIPAHGLAAPLPAADLLLAYCAVARISGVVRHDGERSLSRSLSQFSLQPQR